MKKKIIIPLLFLGILQGTFPTNAQEYTDQLDAVILSQGMNLNVSFYTETHQDLIEKGTFRFKNEIKKAKTDQSVVYFDVDDLSNTTKKTTYLKTLRRAGNRSENISDFETFLVHHITSFPKEEIDLLELTKLFHVVRANTIEGTLEGIGSDLSWL